MGLEVRKFGGQYETQRRKVMDEMGKRNSSVKRWLGLKGLGEGKMRI